MPCAFISGHHRPVLPPVRPDDRRLDGDLGVQLADAQPGPVRAAAASRASTAHGEAAAAARRSSLVGGWARLAVPDAAGCATLARASPADCRRRPRHAARWRRSSAGSSSAGSSAGRSTGCSAGSSALFNRGVRLRHRRLRRASSACCCASASLVLLVYGGLLCLTYDGFSDTPTGFIPPQDKGYLLVNVQLPDSASVERTQEVMQRIEEIAREDARRQAHRRHRRPVDPAERQRPELRRDVRDARRLPPPHEPELIGDAIAARLQDDARRTRSPTALINVFGAPPVDGLGTAGGFKIVIEDRGDTGLDALADGRPSSDRRRRATRRRACRACSPASAPTRPGSTSTSTARRPRRMGVSMADVVQHAAGLPRLALRQRLQPLRPHLAGERAGRRRTSASRSTTSSSSRSATRSGEMVPLGDARRASATSAAR